MRRREFMKLVGGAASARPVVTSRAQQAARMRRVGVLVSTRENDAEGRRRVDLLLRGLKELGWTEGGNINFVYRWAGGDPARAKADAASPLDALLFSIDSMSTRGASGLTLERHWQLMGALESVNGMLLFGVSTAWLFTVAQGHWFMIAAHVTPRKS